jgi:hypothetical protein
MFRHAYDFPFELASRQQDAADVTAEMLCAALIRRASTLSRVELLEACGRFDTVDVVDD